MIKREKTIIWALLLSIMVSWLPCGTVSLASGKAKLSKKNVVLMKGKTCRIKLKSARSKKVRWKSSNRKIVTVNKGVIKARKKGQCVVVAKYGEKEYVCNVKVKEEEKITQTTKPDISTPPVSPSALPSASPVPDQEAVSDTIKLVIDSFDQETKNITFSVANLTDSVIVLTSFYTLEKQENGMWLAVTRKTNSVRADAMIIMPADKITMEANLNSDYENLSDGKYRICMQTSCGKAAAEFVLV